MRSWSDYNSPPLSLSMLPRVQVSNTLYISGQIGFVPDTMEVIKGGVVAETKQALTNMGASHCPRSSLQ